MKKFLVVTLILATILSTNVFAGESITEVTGTIQASIIDVDIPTTASFTINPNGPTFTSPDLVVSNNSTMPVTLSLSGFDNKENSDNQFVEVGPNDKDWDNLGIHESRHYIYLAVAAKDPSEVGYIINREWVGDKSAEDIQGNIIECTSIAPLSDISLNFKSNFGRAFDDTFTTTYDLLFVVSMMD